MPQVTVPPVNANYFQTSLSVHLSAYTFALAHYNLSISQYKTSRPTTKVTNAQGPCLSDTVKDMSQCISQKNQVGFEQMLELLMNLLIFQMVNTYSQRQLRPG